MNLSPRSPLVMTLAAAAAALALSACDRAGTDNRTVGQKVDGAVAGAERKVEQAKDATAGATATVADKAKDAAITASVNAQLAKDSQLSALKINVDTTDGRVALRGTAPDAASRERASRLAQAVDGVKAVDNQLTINKG